MTRVVLIADTHLDPSGAEPEGYHQQPRYVARLPELLASLDEWLCAQAAAAKDVAGSVDLVIHLGDMVDRATPEAVRAAARAFTLSVPLRLVLGNHDMATPPGGPRSDALWLREAPAFLEGGVVTSTLTYPDCVVHLVPTQWEQRPYIWDEVQAPHFLPEQVSALEAALAERPEIPHILCTHSEVLGVPPDQTGRDAPLHSPPAAFTATVLDWIRRFPQLRVIFGGHTHINTHQVREGVHIVTAGAFSETPFEAKVLDVGPGRLSMTTLPLLPRLDFRADYDWDKVFVQGRRRDRSFTEGG